MAGGDEENVISPEALARAEAALANLSDRYLHWAASDLRGLEEALADAQADFAARRDHLARLFQVAHDMKGQAGTFGYPLITEIAGRLCRLIEAEGAPKAAIPEGAEAMVRALRRVLEARLEGDGGAEGRRILAAIRKV